MSLEDIEKELYGQKASSQREDGFVAGDTTSVKSSQNKPWGALADSSQALGGAGVYKDIFVKNSSTKIGKVMIALMSVVIVLLCGVAGYFLYNYFSADDVSITITLPESAMVGERAVLEVMCHNTTKRLLVAPKIVLSLPEGVVYAQDNAKRIIEKNLADLEPQASIKEQFDVIIGGKSNRTVVFNTVFSYTDKSSVVENRFEKKQDAPLLVRDPLLSLDVSLPEKVFVGEQFEGRIRIKNNTSKTLEKVFVRLQFPKEFVLKGSEPAFVQQALLLPLLEANKEQIISFSGAFSASQKDFATLVIKTGITIDGVSFDTEQKESKIALATSLLGLSIQSQKETDAYMPGEEVQYNLYYTNNTQDIISDVIIEATLVGESIDYSSVKIDGVMDPATKVLSWNAASVPELKSLQPKANGYVSLSFKLKDAYAITKISEKNLIFKVKGKISTLTVPTEVTAQKLEGSAERSGRIGGIIEFTKEAYFKEPQSDITNKGLLPPKVGKTTQYTVHIKIDTQGTDFGKVRIAGSLGPGVVWTGKFKANTKSVPVYNERNQEFVWDVGRVSANTGGEFSEPVEAVFQVSYTPAVNMVGKGFVLVSKLSASASDEYTGLNVQKDLGDITSRALNDSTLANGYDVVVQ